MNDKANNVLNNEAIEKSGNKRLLPILALILDIVPIAVICFNSFIPVLRSFTLLIVLLSPIIGLVLGVVSLSKGKSVIGLAGKIIAIIAVILPLLAIGLVVVFFVGATTGMISLM